MAPSAEGSRAQNAGEGDGEQHSGHVNEKAESKWEEVAAALNRLFALIYVVAAIVFFGVFVIPIFIYYSYVASN